MSTQVGAKTIVNLVDEVSPVNFGIWHAAIASAKDLKDNDDIRSVIAAPQSTQPFPETQYPFVKWMGIKDFSKKAALEFFSNFQPESTIIASHGCWRFPTRWGSWAIQQGFRWVYCPHGMLEPWSMNHKWLKKKIYFEFWEKPMARKANLVRAVGSPEERHLKNFFPKVIRIANGIYDADFLSSERSGEKIRVLFLARLHHKKGVMPMVNAWKQSRLWQHPDYELVIGGTDDGEQGKLLAFIQDNPGNVRFLGPVFGDEKRQLLQQTHYYILPSVSEGFPTSVLEAMAAGLLCIITKGCNFPEALEGNHAMESSSDSESLIETFNQLTEIQEDERRIRVSSTQNWLKENFLWSKIASQQAYHYFQL